jgi:hypothetical protein
MQDQYAVHGDLEINEACKYWNLLKEGSREPRTRGRCQAGMMWDRMAFLLGLRCQVFESCERDLLTPATPRMCLIRHASAGVGDLRRPGPDMSAQPGAGLCRVAARGALVGLQCRQLTCVEAMPMRASSITRSRRWRFATWFRNAPSSCLCLRVMRADEEVLVEGVNGEKGEGVC